MEASVYHETRSSGRPFGSTTSINSESISKKTSTPSVISDSTSFRYDDGSAIDSFALELRRRIRSTPVNKKIILSHTSTSTTVSAIDALWQTSLKGKAYDQYIFVKNLDWEEFQQLSCEGQSLAHARWSYDESLLTGIVKLPGPLHEAAHRRLGKCIETTLWSMTGVTADDFVDTGSTRYLQTGGVGRRRSKEGDTAFRPAMKRPRRLDRPTLVIEAGDSEKIAELRDDARWWLLNYGGEVHIVVLISVRERRKELVIERWEMAGPTRATQEPTCIQNIVIKETSQNPPQPASGSHVTINQTTFIIVGAPLVLSFEKCLLVQPDQGQSDIILSDTDLASYAYSFWSTNL